MYLILLIFLFFANSNNYAQEFIGDLYAVNGKNILIMKDEMDRASYQDADRFCKQASSRICNLDELRANCSKVLFIKLFKNPYVWAYDSKNKKPVMTTCLKKNLTSYPSNNSDAHFFKCCKDLN